MSHSIEHIDTIKLWNRVITVQDQVTAKMVSIRRAECGLPNCNCALEFADRV
jgi:hypothetical protein